MEEDLKRVYFCGSDVYNCLNLCPHQNTCTVPFKTLVALKSIVSIEFTHLYAIYKKRDSEKYSWYLSGLGLSETQIFAAPFCVTDVSACKNSLGVLTEDGTSYIIRFDSDNGWELVRCNTSEMIPICLKTNCWTISFTKIVCNENHVYGLQKSQEISKIYQLGHNSELIAEFPGIYIQDFDVGYGHFVAFSDTGGIWNWGHCGRSELASSSDISTISTSELPIRVEFFDDLPSIVVKVVCGGWHTLVLTSDGDVYSWGWNESGQLGHNTKHTSSGEPYPVDIGSAEDPVVDISAGSRHSAVLLKSGRLYTWGRNEEGQCGLGDVSTCSEPEEVVKCWEGRAMSIKCGKWATFVVSK